MKIMNCVIKRKFVIWGSILIFIILIGIIGLIFLLRGDVHQLHQNGAVVANGIECSEIGRKILAKGGSAVDAGIATLFCEGVACPQSMGLGGGFLATVYIRSTKTVQTLVARESAPLRSTADMFVNKTVEGALSVAVPGELRGYWSLHEKYGKLPWSILIQPTIELCENGIEVSAYLSKSLDKYRDIIKNKTNNLHEIFINPKTNDVWTQGDLMKRPQLAKTLQIIAKDGDKAMYNGGILGKQLAADVQELGGILTEEDFTAYEIRWGEPLTVKIDGGYTLYTIPLPGSGIILTFILNLLNGLMTENRSLYYHRMVESFKHGYGQRSQLGDNQFNPSVQTTINDLLNPVFIDSIRQKIRDDRTYEDFTYYGANFSNIEDHGTANMAVLAPNGDAITVTSTINTIFGAKFRSKQTGIILNDEMDDFSTPGQNNGFGIPPSPANYIEPKKMPMSSMCPSIILNENGDVRLLIGAAGGSKITTSVAQAIINYLIFNTTLNDAVQSKRIHHQLAPMEIEYEDEFNQSFLEFFQKIGHKVKFVAKGIGFSALTAIGKEANSDLTAVYDFRRNGSIAILENS